MNKQCSLTYRTISFWKWCPPSSWAY